VVLPQAEVLQNFPPETLAELLAAAVLREDRGPAFPSHDQVTALAAFERASLLGEVADVRERETRHLRRGRPF